jgi:hypothetical protein
MFNSKLAKALYVFTRELLPNASETEVKRIINLRVAILGNLNESLDNLSAETAEKIREDFSRMGSQVLNEWIMGIYVSDHHDKYVKIRKQVYEMFL